MTPIEQLRLFRYRAAELSRRRLIREGLSVNFTVKWDRMKGLRYEATRPDQEDLRSFLLDFRHFVSQKEPVYLPKVYNLCHRGLSSDGLKQEIIKARASWKEALRHNGINVIIRGKRYPPEHVCDLWVNGVYFHSDLEKRRELEALHLDQQFLLRHYFHMFLAEATRNILFVGNVVSMGLREGLFRF